jgi:hypothetical protein
MITLFEKDKIYSLRMVDDWTHVGKLLTIIDNWFIMIEDGQKRFISMDKVVCITPLVTPSED